MNFHRRREMFTSANDKLDRKMSCNPRSTNRGVQTPKKENTVETVQFDDLCRTDYNGMLASIDWLEFTAFDFDWHVAIADLLGLDPQEFTDSGHGGGGYTHMLRCNFADIRVLFGARDEKTTKEMGVHFTLPGDGCRALFSRVSPDKVIKTLLSYNENVQITRLDMALDNIGDIYFYPRDLKQYYEDGLVKSRWVNWQLMQSGKNGKKELTGDTFYLGSRTSELFCRVYDKTLERIANDDTEVPEHWVRWELVCKHDRAQAAAEQLVKSGFALGEVMFGILSNYFCLLKENPNDSHKERWPMDERWANFLGDVQPIRLYRIVRKEKTLDDKIDWVTSQVRPTLSAIMQVYGTEWFEINIGLGAWRGNKTLEHMTIQAAQELEQFRKEVNKYWSTHSDDIHLSIND